jgi:hypothetical protein
MNEAKNVEQPTTVITRRRVEVKTKAYPAWMPDLSGHALLAGDYPSSGSSLVFLDSSHPWKNNSDKIDARSTAMATKTETTAKRSKETLSESSTRNAATARTIPIVQNNNSVMNTPST